MLKDGYRLKMEREEKARNVRFRMGRIVGNAWFWVRRGWTLLGIMPGEVMSFLAYKVGKRILGTDDTDFHRLDFQFASPSCS